MAHIHNIVDSDTHFKIDPITRKITNENNKVTLVQHDHHSECFSFDMPRYIDGHDMMECDKVEIHFLNLAANKKESHPGIYKVTDFDLSDKDDNVLTFTWLVSENATHLVGLLIFAVHFTCTNADGDDYRWSTLLYDNPGVSVGESIYNSEVITRQYVDVLEQWRKEVYEIIGSGGGGTSDFAINNHNADNTAHQDIRLLITELSNRFNAVLDSEDVDLDQLSELVEYIKSNRSLIEQVTTNKVNVTDIINNLSTNATNKPLSAAQGVVLKSLIDAITVPTKTSDLINDSGFLTEAPELSIYATKEELSNHNTNGSAHNDIRRQIDNIKVPTKTSDLTNDSGFVSEREVSNVYATKPDLEQLRDEVDALAFGDYAEEMDAKLGGIISDVADLDARVIEHTEDDTIHVTSAEKQTWNEHNTNTTAHNDIRLLIDGLTTRLNTLANSDDITLDQMAEVVAYIKSNRSLIESVTTDKVNVSDIVNNLVTNVSNIPLSAAQGVALKALIDEITVPTKLSDLTGDSTHRLVTDSEKEAWNRKSNFSGYYEDLLNKPFVATKVSELSNDAGYVTEEQIETGELTWDSIKGNVVDFIDTYIEWDGNIEGREVFMWGSSLCYKVSDKVFTDDEFCQIIGKDGPNKVGKMTITYENENTESVIVGLTEANGFRYSIMYGVVCVFDSDLTGVSTGTYFTAINYSGNGMPLSMGPYTVEKIKSELLPDNIGSGSVDKYFETVDIDTLTWDGNTNGLYNFSNSEGSYYHVSDAMPTAEEIANGGTIKMTMFNGDGYDELSLPIASLDILDPETAGMPVLMIIFENKPLAIIAYDLDLPSGLVGNLQKTGIYFFGIEEEGVMAGWIKSLTINGYNKFGKKEVIKEEYLPQMSGVKTVTFINATDLYNFVVLKGTQILKVVMSMGGVFFSFTNITNDGSGEVYLENVSLIMVSTPMSVYGTSVYVGENSLKFYEGGIDVDSNGQVTCLEPEPQEMDDVTLQSMGVELTVYYID